MSFLFVPGCGIIGIMQTSSPQSGPQSGPQPAQEVISPAEARFWDEWAAKAPALVRRNIAQINPPAFMAAGAAGVALGVVLGVASFSKKVPGKWKILTGGTAIGSALAGALGMGVANSLGVVSQRYREFADRLEASPELQKDLAAYLSSHIDAQTVGQNGIERAVMMQTSQFAHDLPPLRVSELRQTVEDCRCR
jgi:hypothetical protein